MKIDIRSEVARYYDRNPDFINDIPFYQDLIPSPGVSILELGCGTGRVTLPLVPHCHFILGIDISGAMLAVCREKLAIAGISKAQARVIEGDITDFDLGQTFDLIIAPYRVIQNLATDREVDGLFRCIRKHLADRGTCVLNAFKPLLPPEALRQRWETQEEILSWEVPVEGGRLACYDRKARIDGERLILYPELIYRRYEGQALVEESVLKIAMRCYYPHEFEKLIREHGFEILKRWGGYKGERYGEGPELVIQFGEGGQARRSNR